MAYKKDEKYLSSKELVQIYGLTHPDEPLGTRSAQIKALHKMYNGNKSRNYDKDTERIASWVVYGTIFALFLLAALLFGTKLIFLPFFF